MARREMTYYDSRDGRRQASARRRFSIIDWLMMIVSVIVAAGVALSWMAQDIIVQGYS